MPLDPFLQSFVPTLTGLPNPITDFNAWRTQDSRSNDAMTVQLTEPGPEVEKIYNVRIGTPPESVELRVYYPPGDGPHPVHLYLHGGGWIGGSIHDRLVDTLARERCIGASCVVVTVNYRKAPEHKFPAGLNDCYTALLWVAQHPQTLNIRPDLITLGGQSAGANLAAALSLKVRDERGPAVVLQLLEVPCLDLTLSQPSYRSYGTGYGLELPDIKRLVGWYMADTDDITHRYISPLLAPDLAGLPPAHIMPAEFDPLCDDGLAYAKRLTEAGVPAPDSLQRGHIHTSNAFTTVMSSAGAWREEVAAVLNQAHDRHADAPS